MKLKILISQSSRVRPDLARRWRNLRGWKNPRCRSRGEKPFPLRFTISLLKTGETLPENSWIRDGFVPLANVFAQIHAVVTSLPAAA